MGAVRILVKLTNAIDEALVSRGLLAPDLLRECDTPALVDTDALSLVIPAGMVGRLGSRIRGQRMVQYADGREESVGAIEPVIIDCQGRQTVGEALVTGDEVLIGQVVLEQLDFLVNCKNQQLIPNLANPNYPIAMIK
ncbi:clan AA aspartic protease [Microcoleus sp. FACHB-672]|uniref:clan AA aspartic protease n=1 Tax=Microcoleus sp. FACHB-672 TaxID=2692825 RepID=UPI0016847562|nr:clan AA aspartic protease [Microcoleus sp. FACHB-672]MBD2041560.1 clan AA aspartic protease [Microcoleus sp. FACHB-672]